MDCIDPVTKEPFEDPYLASDGETYSKATLQQCMAADPWHRSPVTYEVLRPAAYRNVFMATLLGEDACSPDTLQLYDAAAAPPPEEARTVTWRLPARLSAQGTLVRRRFGLPDAPFAVTAVVWRGAGDTDWLMHPPAAREMWDDVLALSALVGATKATANPWCLTFAQLDNGRTVEAQWLSART